MAETQIFMKCMDCEYKSEAFHLLTYDQMARVDLNRTEITYPKGEILCKQGSFVPNLLYIKKGLVKVYLENGINPTIVSIEKGGAFIGLPSLYSSPIFHYSAEALSDTEVCLTDIQVFRELILENPEFAAKIIEMINHDLVKSYNRLFSITQKQVNGRFAEMLLYMSKELFSSNPFKLLVSRKDMSELISTSPESVSRLMTEYKNEEIIKVTGHVVTILDMDKLKEIAIRG